MKKIFLLAAMAVTVWSCKKDFDAEPTYAKASIAGTWAKAEQFYAPQGERFDEATSTWRRFTAFTVTSDGEPDKIGFVNLWVPGKGTNALDMNRLYTAESISSDSGYYNITIAKCFQFIPGATDPTVGTVKVLEQDVRIWRRNGTSFVIKIAPGTAPGTYNVATKVFEVEVSFDESNIGGPAVVRRKYRFTA